MQTLGCSREAAMASAAHAAIRGWLNALPDECFADQIPFMVVENADDLNEICSIAFIAGQMTSVSLKDEALEFDLAEILDGGEFIVLGFGDEGVWFVPRQIADANTNVVASVLLSR